MKAAAYRDNFGAEHFILSDVADLTLADVPPRSPDLVWASPPCQDLSVAGNGAGLDGARSGALWPRWRLMRALIGAGRGPRVVVIENVAALLTSNGGADFVAIEAAFAEAGYHCRRYLIDARHFLPQSRQRVFIVAAPLGQTIPDLPPLPERATTLANFIDFEAPCDAPDKTAHLVSLMASSYKAWLEAAMAAGRRVVLAGYRRTRGGVQRFEVRDDGLAGALRTAAGGSSVQDLILVDGEIVRSRKLSPREAARLMGLRDNYRLAARASDANTLIGDGVAVPVAAFLAPNVLTPMLERNVLEAA